MDLATILAFASFFAAVVAPVVTAYINQRGAYKTKAAELFFSAKIDAYKSFLAYTAQFPNRPSADDLRGLEDVVSPVLMLSSSGTAKLVSLYGQSLANGASTPSQGNRIGTSRGHVIQALSTELGKYQK